MAARPVFQHRQFDLEPGRVDAFQRAISGGEPPAARAGDPAPIGMLLYVTTYGADEIHERLGFSAGNVLFGGTELRYHGAARAGDVLGVQPVIASDTTRSKPGSASLRFVEIETRYTTAAGDPVLTERSTVIERQGAGA